MTATHTTTDHQIQTAIVKELDWTPGVESAHIGVAVTDGAVTLSGEVMTLPERTAAVRSALRIPRVLALVDEITVRSPGHHHDADIARDVNTALLGNVQLREQPVTATVLDGRVSLAGTVDWHFQREAARRCVEVLTGVLDVIDGIAVRATAVQADAQDRITEALARGARRDADGVRVSVSGHTARLDGQVSSFKERREAERAAWSARGITEVRNNLVIVP